jgi:hypothetical protein
MNPPLQIWTVYDHPTDYPTEFVARLWLNDSPSTEVLRAPTLSTLRSLLPAHLYCIPRHIHDQPNILEIWL